MQAGSPAECGADQPGDQLRVLQTGRRPHPREHRRRGEARHRVDLVEVHLEVAGQEEVHAGQAGTVQRGEGTPRVVPDLPADPLRQVGRNVELARVVEVLGLEVVELMIPHDADLGEQRGIRPAAVLPFQYPAFDLPAGYRLLDEYLRVDRAGRGHGRVQVGPVADLGDAVRGTGPGRLDEHRPAQPQLVRLAQRLPGAQD